MRLRPYLIHCSKSIWQRSNQSGECRLIFASLLILLLLIFVVGCTNASEQEVVAEATAVPPTNTPNPTAAPTDTAVPLPTATPEPTWETLALTPPMGWNSFNYFGCDIDEQLILETADAMIASGMADVGYEYVNLDDCWMARERDADGNLVPDPEKFPNGIKYLADYMHERGLKLGVYLDRGEFTCAGYPGSYGYEVQDANKLAEWGVDYLKYDNCDSVGDIIDDFQNMHDALRATGRPIVFSMCTWGFPGSYFAEQGLVHLWRTTTDIKDNWGSVKRIIDANHLYHPWAKPGQWNDPDMLEVGNGGMTEDEYHSHFGLWAMMAAPLLAGNDLRNMDQATIDILTAEEVIAVDQDPLGIQGKRVVFGDFQVWVKPLTGENTFAVAFYNTTEESADISAIWEQIGLPDGPVMVRDLWAGEDVGIFEEAFTTTVPPHGTSIFKMTAVTNTNG